MKKIKRRLGELKKGQASENQSNDLKKAKAKKSILKKINAKISKEEQE